MRIDVKYTFLNLDIEVQKVTQRYRLQRFALSNKRTHLRA